MSSLAEMRAQLRELRKDSVKPVSRMRKGDISDELNRLRELRETTPAVRATPVTLPRSKEVESIKKAKASEFPVVPDKKMKKKLGEGGAGQQKKASSKSKLLQMLSEMSDSD